ncbi:hypothetical protein [Rugosimonospora africana]|uniref:hypothetical protein n=1 Tax=Rugosimonospora africana TaxID=556532 RepID=UPI00194453F8|nr:hypothetical protein [Rugosimonospora africana]
MRLATGTEAKVVAWMDDRSRFCCLAELVRKVSPDPLHVDPARYLSLLRPKHGRVFSQHGLI